MAYLNTVDAYTDLKAGVLKGIHANFPLEGKKQSIHLEGLTVRDEKFDPNDIEAQHQARMEGKTWASPVFGQLVLKDNQTGNVIDRQSVKLADIPHMTKRYSYIVDGKEIQVDNQWQLKPGVYTRRRANGELETQFNSPNRAFHMHFDPESKIFHMERGKSGKIPVYPLMKAMGVDDDTLEKSWGKEVLKVNQGQRAVSTALERFFKADRKRAPTDKKEALDYFHQSMRETTFDPESTEITLGHPHKSLTGDVFTAVTKKMLDVQNGSVPEDERDALVFKSLRTTADFAHDKLTAWNTRKQILPKVNRKINTARNIREVVKGALFNGAVKSTFTANALARTADQVNPLEMMEGAFQTTVMGPGGIQIERSVSEEAKLISESHFGFLDPIHTPEGNKTGVTLHLPLGVVKEGNKPTIPVFNMRTGQAERIDPVTFYKSKVALPDQVKWQGGKPVALSKEVQLSDRGNAVIAGGLHTADYVMRSPSQLFSTASNLIPWLGSNSGNRASYADTQMKQAISLKHREAPLVQTATGTKAAGLDTFEGFLGSQSAHVAPVGGTVTTVNKNHILVRGDDGKERKVSLYNNFPLNDPKAVLDSTAVVKVGQKVTRGQVVADNNFTRDGKLALGTNLRVGYLPYKGQNFEDGVVISRSAAEKMTSVHMHKPEIQLADTTITDARRFAIHHPEAFTRDQLAKVGENGIVHVGQKVKPGDPLVLATKPYDLKGRDSIAAVRRSLSTQQSNSSLTWKSDFPGEVVGVHRDKSGNVRVHVRTEEPMQIGDKLTGRAGNKGIVTNILEDHEMPRTQSGHLEVLLNPAGIPGRMNMGQVFETVASKIARKTGQPYVVQNFEHGVDQLARIKADLAKHGIPDQEEVHDPISGRSLGKALVGEQHLFKLNFQVDKKISARAGNVLEGNEPEFYDNNLIPAGGGKTGAQSLGNLALYSMLSHGATANIREMQTLKSEGPDVRYGGKKWDSQHQQVWNAIQTGERIPAPKKTFAFQKFEDMLRASGVDVVKKGHRLQLTPLTNSQVLAMSSGEVKDPTSLTYSKLDKSGEPAPIPGGLFDPKLTGGHGGRKWTHMKLAEPMPNPVFEGAIQKVLGMGTKNYSAIVNGERAVKDGKLVELDTPGSMAGGAAIAHMLSQIDTKTELEKAKKELAAVRIPDQLAHRDSTTKLDQAYKRVKYLQALDNAGITAKDAYTLHNLPIIPPAMRPASVLPDGSIKWDDINGMYKRLGENNVEMKHENFMTYLPDSRKAEFRAEMYDGLKALMGVGTSKSEDENESRGLFQQIAGANPKRGYFQGTLLKRRQDMTMRGTITPDAGMGLDNVGIPQDKALTLFRPFVTRKLVEMGSAPSPLDAHKMLSQKGVKDRSVYRALDLVMEERPVLLKRDPALHKHSIQAFKAHRVPGKSIMIHPLVTGGFGADFDGDSCLGSILCYTVEMAHAGSVASFKVIDLADFPRVEESRRELPNGVVEYDVPAQVYVPGYRNGSVRLFEATGYSVHQDCEEWIVTTRGGREIRCYSDHSLALLNPNSFAVEQTPPRGSVGLCMPIMRDLKDGLWGSAAGNASGSAFANDMVEVFDFNFNNGWFLGVLCGDGWVSGSSEHRQVSLSHGSLNRNVVQCWESLARYLGGTNTVTKTEMPHEFEGVQCLSAPATISCTAFGNWLLPMIGHGARGKHLPERFLETPVEFRRGMFIGLIDTDGTACWSAGSEKKKPQFSLSFTTTSERLAHEAVLLGLSLGVGSGSSEYVNRERPVWIVTFSIPMVKASLHLLKLVDTGKQQALDRLAEEAVGASSTDVVPLVPSVVMALLKELRKMGAARKGKNRNNQAFTWYTSVKATSGYILRDTARRILDAIKDLPGELSPWAQVVANESVGWDIVESASPTGEVQIGR